MDDIKWRLGTEVLTGKGNLCCFARGQTVQVLLECNEILGNKGLSKSNLD